MQTIPRVFHGTFEFDFNKINYSDNWMEQGLNIAWTTVGTKEAAIQLAQEWIKGGTAVCVHIEGPIESVYNWEGATQLSTEYRLMVKFLDVNTQPVEALLKQHHPYTIPQWIVVKADRMGEAYRMWAESSLQTYK